MKVFNVRESSVEPLKKVLPEMKVVGPYMEVVNGKAVPVFFEGEKMVCVEAPVSGKEFHRRLVAAGCVK